MSSEEHNVIAKQLLGNYNTLVNKYMKSRDNQKEKNFESYFIYSFVKIVTWKLEKEETLNFITVIKLLVQI
jgi:uncharacterized Rmd1/YagE family protein